MVTDPPYALINTEHFEDRVDKILRCFNDVVFPNFNNGDIECFQYSELIRILLHSSNLRRFETVAGVESWVGVPEGAIDFNYDIKVRQIEITTGAESSSIGITNGKLMNEVDTEGSEFIGDFILDFGDAIDFPTSNSKGCCFGQFFSGLFTVPISSILAPCFPSLQSPDSPLLRSDDFVENIRLTDNTLSQSESSPFVLASWRAKHGFMLRFNLAGASGELVVADSTNKLDSLTQLIRPQLIRTFAGASCLSTMFKSIPISFVFTFANRTYSFCFHFWAPKSFSKSIQYANKEVKGFMGKQWDGMVPSVDIWKECLRVLKPGAFAFVMCIPRQDCLARMIVNLTDAGFRTDFTSIYWTYANGFPKAANIGKLIDNRLGAEREAVGTKQYAKSGGNNANFDGTVNEKKRDITVPVTDEAKALDGSYAGFQPKPAVEVILVCMKPLSEKTYVDQALEDGKGITWIDNCRIPVEKQITTGAGKGKIGNSYNWSETEREGGEWEGSPQGRFPANLLVSDDALSDGKVRTSGYMNQVVKESEGNVYGKRYAKHTETIGDSGSYSRFFDIDAWFSEKLKQLPPAVRKIFPFLAVPKASGSERTQNGQIDNTHSTVKPLKLMSYLIVLGSRMGDIVLDPFAGTCTTALAARILQRKFLMIEIEPKYAEIGKKRLEGERSLFD